MFASTMALPFLRKIGKITSKVDVVKTIAHRAEHGLHLVYFAAVWMEGHGIYSMAGGGLFLLFGLNLLLHFDSEA